MHTHTHTHIHAHITFSCTYIHMHIHTHMICTHIHMPLRIHKHTNTQTHKHIHKHIHTYICVYLLGKGWICMGDLFVQLDVENASKLISKEQTKLDDSINEARDAMKVSQYLYSTLNPNS